MTAGGEATEALRRLRRGEEGAAEELLPLVYGELRRLAAHHLAGERRGHTLQATALVHEAYLRLVDQTMVDLPDRAHFFGLASELIRRILVDHARRRNAAKRGGGADRLRLESADVAVHRGPELDLIALDEALEELGRLNGRQRRIVELRYFGGLTIDETAELLDRSPSTIKAEWSMARAWLRQRLG